MNSLLSPATWYYIHEDGYARIPLKGYDDHGQEAVVDIEDLAMLGAASTEWVVDSNGYAASFVDYESDKVVYNMHRMVACKAHSNADNLPIVDHINRRRVDNRRCNLRWVTYKENRANAGQPFYVLDGKKGASMYQIIYWQEDDCGDWIVQQKYMAKTAHLGRFKGFAEAKALAAKTMAELQRLHGHKRAGIKLKPRDV